MFFFQYVEKLEKIIRFIIKEKALSLKDLDSIWAAQVSNTYEYSDAIESVLS